MLNFKPLSCTSKAPPSIPLHKVIIDIVFSLCMKDVGIGFSLSRGVLDWKVSMAFNMNFYKVCAFGLPTLFYNLCKMKTKRHVGQLVSDRDRQRDYVV